ncbi:hypothetical protein SCLCIDRAFT_11544 [Scleroderma citrinum Foug A]|uniref:Uncharacterized protein n=1 Tax=Scleroderma citrinum Foug A TaxID=1036808 RepID=A0A0C3CYB1_9AGAM|nr:hypothetical protein SCLCIDRAFT_11544 [Scleroderma citrinum Foug A]
MACWTVVFAKILMDHQAQYIAQWGDAKARLQILHNCRDQILKTPQANHPNIALPDSIRAISAEEWEAAARPHKAGEYKREWDAFRVACRLFKEELDALDMSTRDQKDRSTFGKRTKTAHKWFDLLPKEKKREAKKVAVKWNQEGAPKQQQVVYRKKNLKNMTNEFLGVLRRMMGVHAIMLVGYEKNVGMATAFFEADPPKSQSKPFSTHSSEAKNWARGGADLIADYLMHRKSDESRESSEEDNETIPEVPVDRSGNPRLPSRLGLKLKLQQLLVREIFKKAYGKVAMIKTYLFCIDTNCPVKFTRFSRALVPWLLLTKDPEEYIDDTCYPAGFLIHDPSKLTKLNVNKLWHHWEQREQNNEVVLCFIGAKPDDMPAPSNEKPNSNDSEDKDDDKDGSSDDHDHGTSRSLMCPAGSSTATKRKDGTSSGRTPLSKPCPAGKSSPAKGKVGSLSGSKDRPLPGLVKKPSSIKPSSPAAHKGDRGIWSWQQTHLPEEIHKSEDSFQGALMQLTSHPWKSRNYGTAVVLRLGLLIWDCWRAQELEQPEDGEQKTAPEFLYSSLLGVQQVEGVFVEVDGICLRLDQVLLVEPGAGGESGGEEARKRKEDEETRRRDEVEKKRQEEEQKQEEERREEERREEERREEERREEERREEERQEEEQRRQEEERQRQEEERQRQEEERQRQEEERQRQEDAGRRQEEEEKQRKDKEEKWAQEAMKTAHMTPESSKKGEAETAKGKKKGGKQKAHEPSPIPTSNNSEHDELESEGEAQPPKRKKMALSRNAGSAKNTRSSKRDCRPTKKIQGSLLWWAGWIGSGQIIVQWNHATNNDRPQRPNLNAVPGIWILMVLEHVKHCEFNHPIFQ